MNFFAKPAAQIFLKAMLLIGVIVLTYFVVHRVFIAPRAAAERHGSDVLKNEQSKGQVAAAKETVRVVVENSTRSSNYDRHVRESTSAIEKTEGADDDLDPALHRIGLESLCVFGSYVRGSECSELRGADPVVDEVSDAGGYAPDR